MNLPHKQRGVGLIIFFLALILAGSVFLLTHIEPEQGRVVGEAKTSRSLAAAKQALLSYATSYYLGESNLGISHLGRHGILPCPEQSGSPGEGFSVGNCASTHESSLGRLPWKSLGVSPLKDASGECLWYAVSGGFFNSPASPMTNDDTPGMFQVSAEDGSLIAGNTPESRVVAVIIAPGKPLSGQTRSSASAQIACQVSRDNVSATDYLDSHQGINNSAVDTVNPDRIETFITASGLSDNPAINDRIITITTDEIFDTIKKSTALYDDKIGALGIELGNCLVDYAKTGAPPPTSCPNLTTCKENCRNVAETCRDNATTGQEKQKCAKEAKKCRVKCDTDCSGSGGTNYRLPWPASVNLNPLDYRDDGSYADLDEAGVTDPTTGQGYLGRLPNTTANSLLANPGSDPDIFTSCDLATSNPEMYTLWQHWKDHWFYVVGEEFSPTGTNGSCINCPKVDAIPQSAVLIFSGERLNNQLRRSDDTEDPDPAIADSKADIENYLEGDNFNNYPDAKGDKEYSINNVNDRLFCIAQDLSTVTECPTP